MLGGLKMIGDPSKAAQAIIKIAGEPDPPLRLQLGTDCLELVRNQARSTIAESEKWESLSHSTNADDYDKGIMSKIAMLAVKE
jgi:hypothetical protein